MTEPSSESQTKLLETNNFTADPSCCTPATNTDKFSNSVESSDLYVLVSLTDSLRSVSSNASLQDLSVAKLPISDAQICPSLTDRNNEVINTSTKCSVTTKDCIPIDPPEPSNLVSRDISSNRTCEDIRLSCENEVTRLRDQLSQMSLHLITAQDQLDKLLEEKRSWLQSSNRLTLGELRGRWLQAKTLADNYKREKEDMVMKYAKSEQRCMYLEKRVQGLEQSFQGAIRKSSSGDQLNVINNDQSESYTGEPNEWQQRFLKLEKTLVSTREQIDALKKTNSLAESRIGSLEKRLNQTSESLRAEEQKVSSQSFIIARLSRSLEIAQKEAKDAERLREREAGRLCTELAYQEAQEKLRLLTSDNETLKKQLGEMKTLRMEAEENQSRLSELMSETAVIPELRYDLDTLRLREEHLSDAIRKLTERNVCLQTEHLESMNRLCELERQLRAQEESNKATAEEAEKILSSERSRNQDLETRLRETQLQVQRLREHESKLLAQLNDVQEQAALIHKRDTGRIRDLARQLARVSHNQVFDSSLADYSNVVELSKGGDPEVSSSVHDQHLGSRTTSLCSIEPHEPDIQLNTTAPLLVGNALLVTGEQPISRFSTDYYRECPHTASPLDDSERTAWLAKIDRLQREQLRLTDKNEFLQERCHHLTEQLCRKSRIIQSLLATDNRMEPASLPSFDAIHEHVARIDGPMTPVCSEKTSKKASTRDACLEMNQKLQMVLEDALFKNITFKDNLNTLGSEVSRLKKLLTEIRDQLCGTCFKRTAEFFPC